ncbi:NADH:quinone oxidoreductase [Pseudomonas sp. Z5-35]|uniref:Rnf-Nqr domain containing protein n=1 Tax=unclassified Pseudomonas TaxID=196821 RepID=UPI003DA7FC84
MNKPAAWTRGLVLVPLVGASDSLINSLLLWCAWVLISFTHGGTMILLRQRLTANQRLLASVVLAATLTACAGLVAQAWLLERHAALSLYIGWIAVSCVALEHATIVEPRMAAHLRLAGQFGLLIITLGALRELIGRGVPLALLAPGGFILLGLLLAAYQACKTIKAPSPQEEPPRP